MPERIPERAFLFFLFFASLIIYATGAAALPLMDRDEPRFAESAREMRQSGDFLVPRFNHEARYDKPPLVYWCQAAAYNLFGENDFAARFPSAAGAALTTVIVFGFGRRLRNKKTGFWAAVLFASSAHTLVLAKAATADMLLALFYTLSVWAAWELLVKRSFLWRVVLYTSLALGFLTKGPVIFLPLLSSCIFIKAKRSGPDGGHFLWGPGILWCLFLIGLWAVPALIGTHGEYFRIGIGRHVVERSLGPMEGHGAKSAGMYLLTLPFYFITLFFSFFPGSLRLPKMARLLQKNRGKENTYLLFQIACVFIIFSFLRTKLPHYTFPALPLLSLLLANLWAAEGLPARALARASVTMVVLSLAVSLIAFPALSHGFPSRELAQQCSSELKPEMLFAAAGYEEPSLVWYFRKYVRSWRLSLPDEEMPRFMAGSGGRFCVLSSESFRRLFPDPDPRWKIHSVRGLDPAKGRFVNLTAAIKLE